ncbi:B-cell scaffold protein with ankyrin repeats-like [Sinocyclocheilus grahami]|uniref:B-cell scaffold protein with ankyrin repeats-like n=1 Tax=Sinocyclocheilus grahami TaxID=75366 RepID=UPI0007AD0095|nr:PREDICTED: B-cell scaffold protein with ankyrin repeats-like [Sinocyclocheilus grahami]
MTQLEQEIPRIRGATIFSTLDVASGFWTIPVHPDDQHKLAFTFGNRQYTFTRCPFGYANSPAEFNIFLNKACPDARVRGNLIYVDDLLMKHTTVTDHLKEIDHVLHQLTAASAKIALHKGQWCKTKVNYNDVAQTQLGTALMSNMLHLLIIYEAEAEQWASYLHFHLVGPIPEAGICCYDIALVTSRRDDFLRLGGYKCKLLILSRGMLEGLCQLRRFFLARVLRPETSVVILLCGVESLDPLLELVPLKGDQCLQISSEQEPQDYQLAVAEIVHKGGQTAAVDGISVQELKIQKKLSSGALVANQSLLVLPSRVPCENPMEIFILLQEDIASKDAEVEFSGNKQRVRVKPVNWNESTLKVTAPDFTAGHVIVTLYSKGLVKGIACLQYYTIMEDIAHFLQQAADPVMFMCQAFQVSSLEKLDQTLASGLMRTMPTGGFQGLQCDQSPAGECHSEDIPTLLHFAAQHGLRDLASALLQCPGSRQALKIPNSHGHTPLDLAHVHGHNQLYILLQESLILDDNDGNIDTGVYELMGRADT